MNKQYFLNKVRNVNSELSKMHIPFQYEVVFETGKHPALHIASNTGSTQVRKGNYEQLWASLLLNYEHLVNTFTHKAKLTLQTKTEIYSVEYDNEIPLELVLQATANLLRCAVTCIINDKYFFQVFAQ